MNRPEMQRALAQKQAELTQSQHKQGEQRKHIKRLEDKLADVRDIELPEAANESEAQLIGDMALRIMRALEA